MAQGTFALFEEFAKYIGDGSHDLNSDSFKVMLITEQVGGTPTIAPGDTTPDSADYTEVSGTNYTAGGEAIAVTWTEAAGTATFDVTPATTVWTQNAAGPATIKTALIYNVTHAGTNDAVGFMDMTANGTSPISLIAGNITITWQPTLFTLA